MVSEYTNMDINRKYTGSDPTACRPQKLKIRHNTSLATQKDKVEQNMKHYWLVRHELAVIDGITMKSKSIIIPFLLQRQILDLLHNNHIGIKRQSFSAGAAVLDEYEIQRLKML